MAPLKRPRVVLLLAGVALLFILLRWTYTLPPLADVAPPATCGNNRCEIGEKATVRIPGPGTWDCQPNVLCYPAFGRSVSYFGSEADGTLKIAFGGLISLSYDTGEGWASDHGGAMWLYKVNRDGTEKSHEELFDGSTTYANLNERDQIGKVFAPLGTLGYAVNVLYGSTRDPTPSFGGPRPYMNYDLSHAVKVGDHTYILGYADSMANIGDLDGDGLPELALGTTGSGTVFSHGAVVIVSFNAQGSVKSMRTIPSEGDGFERRQPNGPFPIAGFGKSIAALGDINGDGKKEIAVGDGGINTESDGTIWILSLNADGSVASKARIVPGQSFVEPGSGSSGNDNWTFANSLAGIGDWNGDGVPDLASSGNKKGSSLWFLFLNADKTVKGTREIPSTDLGQFGWTSLSGQNLGSIPDVDGDGKQELLVGAQLIFSKVLDQCPKDCNWIIPPGLTQTSQASSPLTTPDSTRPSTCGNGACDIKELSSIPISGYIQNIPWSSRTPNIEMSNAALAEVGDLDGDGAPDIAVAGRVQSVNSNEPSHENELQIIFLNAKGMQKSVRRIFEGTGGLVTGQDDGRFIGTALANVGDIDGDGVTDLAVTSSSLQNYSQSRAVWTLFLRRDGTIKSFHKISPADAGFTESTANDFGKALAPLGDFDGDGIPDLAIGNPSSSAGNAGGGRVHLLLLKRDGSVKTAKTLLATTFWGTDALRWSQPLPYHQNAMQFGSALASLGDVFHDGRRLLAVGDKGLWMIFLNADFTLSSFKRFSVAVRGLADAGDQNGDGKSDLAVSISPYSDPPNSLEIMGANIMYYFIAGDGTPAFLGSDNFYARMSLDMSIPGPFIASSLTFVRDLDGDQRKEPVFTDGGIALCGERQRGMAWMFLSGVRTTWCAEECDSDNYCSPSFAALLSFSSSSSVPLSSSSVSAVVSSASSLSFISSFSSSAHINTVSSSSIPSSSAHSQATSSFSNSLASFFSASSSSRISFASSSSASSASPASSAFASSSPATSSASSAFASSVAYNAASSVSSQAYVASSRVSSYTQQYSSISFTDDSTPSPRCGDGQLSPSEQCDTGHPCSDGGFCMSGCRCQARSSAARSSPSSLPPQFSSFSSVDTVPYSITSSRCGDGQLDPSEECDTNEPCPDGAFCSVSCQCETRARSSRPFLAQGQMTSSPSLHPSLATPPSRPSSFCGNATLESPETCDDGNTVNGDGCSSSCRQETPNVVASQPLCGNGVVEEGEQCDPPGTITGPPGQAVRTGRAGDGNQLDRDGCSASCTFEILPVTNADGSFRPSVIAGSTDPSLFLSSAPSIARIGPTPQIAPRLRLTGKESPFVPSVDHSYPAAPAPVQAPFWQPSASVLSAALPYGPATVGLDQRGVAGQTGPASVAVMAAGAAAGFAWARRKKRSDLP